jgi:hypothetical protein
MSSTTTHTPGNTNAKPPVTYPRTAWVHTADSPGYKSVQLADATAEKALGVPVFDTAQAAAAFAAPVEQPIPHMARTNNEEQFVVGRSQLGAPGAGSVIQTPPPVTNVFIGTEISADTLALKAKLPDGLDPEALKKELKGAVPPGTPVTPAHT